MVKTKVSSLIIAFILYFIPSIAVIFVLIRHAGYPPVATWFLPIIMFLFSVILIFWGLKVKKYKADKKTDFNPITGSKVLVFAKTGAFAGSCLAGFCLAQTIIFFMYSESIYMQNMIFTALVGFISCVVTTISGLIVENWCIVDDDNDSYKNSILTKKLSNNC